MAVLNPGVSFGRYFSLGLTIATTVAALTALVAVFLHLERDKQLLWAQNNLGERLTTAATTTYRGVQDIDSALTNIANSLVLDAAARDSQFPKNEGDLRERLIQHVATLPALISMSILNADGQWVVSSRFKARPPIPDDPKRPIWYAANRSEESRSFILPPSASPALGIPSLVMGHTARSGNGKLVGIVLAFISVETMSQPYASMVDAGVQIDFRRADGAELYGLPTSEEIVPQWMSSQWKYAVDQNGGAFKASDTTDRAWLAAVRGTNASPFLVTAIQRESDALKAWPRHRNIVIVISAIVMAVIIAMIWVWFLQREIINQKGIAASKARDELLVSLTRDAATKLLNRVGLKQALASRQREAPPIGMIVLGIDRFQVLTDTHGHEAADSLMCQVSRRINSAIEAGDLAARIGNDEFCVASRTESLLALASRLALKLAEPYRFNERAMLLGVSVGVVETGGHDDWAQLLQDGSTTMHRARQEGSGVCTFCPATDRPFQDRLMMEQELRTAIGTDELYMVYQPILDLTKNEVSGFEALMRSPTRGAIPPGTFIPIAESSGLLLPLDRMVKRSPFTVASGWSDRLSVSINCPALEFRDPMLPERIRISLVTAGLSPGRCCIEVTESALLEDDDIVLGVMSAVKKLGVRLAIDDFGSGHASLSYLHRFPFDRIKIDRSFVQAMDTSLGAAAIIDAVLALSRKLGLEVVAEGIETEQQLECIRKLGCQYAQGYFIGRPMAEEKIPNYLKEFSKVPRVYEPEIEKKAGFV